MQTLSDLTKAVFAGLLGALAALALPPFHWLPLIFVAFSGLLWLLDRVESMRSALKLGWSFGFGYFLLGLSWIGNSFFVDPDRFGALAVPAVLGLSAFLALFPTLACAAAYRFARPGLPRVLALAGWWSLFEWVRGTILSGFPWNLVGYVWTVSEATLQLASVIGIYGLSLATVAMAALPGLAVAKDGTHGRLWPVLAAAVGVIALWAGGMTRLSSAPEESVPGIRLRLVQANVPQAMKWEPSARDGILSHYLALSAAPADEPPTHIIWPETALPFPLADTLGLGEVIAPAIPPNGVLLTGAVRRERKPDGSIMQFNSVIAIDDEGRIGAVYDKVRLVPFGEYMPLGRLLPFKKLTEGTADFRPGERARTLAIPGLPPFRPLICYEAIFPGDMPAEGNPKWLLNVTNDAWFGESAGPYQHFETARVRAVEQGLPLVRAANTGISAVIDAYGRTRARLSLNETGILDAALPRPLAGGTIYGRYGNILFFALATLCVAAAGLIGADRPRHSMAFLKQLKSATAPPSSRITACESPDQLAGRSSAVHRSLKFK